MKNKALVSLIFYFLLNSWTLTGAAEAKGTSVPKDEIIEQHCHFETLLAEYILQEEKDDQIRNVFHKINIAINQLIDEKIEQDPSFDRLVFMLMSSLAERFRNHTDRSIFNDRERFSLHAAQMFHKMFFECERLIKLEELFERAASPFESSKEQRGREEIEDEFFETQKFGISSEKDTAKHLSSFFEQPYQSGSCLFKVFPEAPIVQKLKSYRMPFICGLSGTSRVSLAALNKLKYLEKLSLDSDEVYSYFFGISLCLIASNSHSLFETFYGLDICGYKIDFDFTNPYNLYFSMLPDAFKTDEMILMILEEYVAKDPIKKHYL